MARRSCLWSIPCRTVFLFASLASTSIVALHCRAIHGDRLWKPGPRQADVLADESPEHEVVKTIAQARKNRSRKIGAQVDVERDRGQSQLGVQAFADEFDGPDESRQPSQRYHSRLHRGQGRVTRHQGGH